MKFVKSKFVQKLIIILVILMIFNIAVPKQVNAAFDLGGILIKPITSVILSVVVSVDTTMGLLLNGASIRNKSIRSFNRNYRCWYR